MGCRTRPTDSRQPRNRGRRRRTIARTARLTTKIAAPDATARGWCTPHVTDRSASPGGGGALDPSSRERATALSHPMGRLCIDDREAQAAKHVKTREELSNPTNVRADPTTGPPKSFAERRTKLPVLPSLERASMGKSPPRRRSVAAPARATVLPSIDGRMSSTQPGMGVATQPLTHPACRWSTWRLGSRRTTKETISAPALPASFGCSVAVSMTQPGGASKRTSGGATTSASVLFA